MGQKNKKIKNNKIENDIIIQRKLGNILQLPIEPIIYEYMNFLCTSKLV